jgi:8-oxo-dGTP diphosphatase
VVRHASAGHSGERTQDDSRRPLDERGRAQADGLVGQLRAFQLSRIVSSPFDRCVETVEPLARSRELELETSDVLAEGAGSDRVRAFLLDHADGAVLACGHGPELTPLLGKVKKGGTVVLEVADDRLLELGRFPPPG